MEKSSVGIAANGSTSSSSSETPVVHPRKLHLDSLPNLHDHQEVQMFKAADLPSTKLHAFTSSTESRMGLIYTDAAHTVLD